MKKVILVLLSVVAINFLFAQQKGAAISFEKETHDFGEFKEEAGQQEYSFTFTNTGSEPLILNSVKASCGCTATDYTKAPINPGAKGYVKATYNPANRPNKFDKSITVTSNAVENGTKILKITGFVIPRPKGIADLLPTKVGDLRMRSNHFALIKVFNDELKTDTMGIYNEGEAPVKIEFSEVPAHMTIKAVPQTLKPKEKGYLEIQYDGKKQKEWGFVMDRLNMIQNGKVVENQKITVSTDIQENFAKLTPKQKENAPKIIFDKQEFDFGTINLGDKTEQTFTLKNDGKSDLIIRRVKSSCGCTTTGIQTGAVIKAGKSEPIKIKFDSTGKKGNQRQTITLTTNDPNNSTINLVLKGTVNEVKN